MKKAIVVLLLIALALLMLLPRIRESIDRHRFPRKGFGAVWAVTTGHRVDTIRGLATKDLVGSDTTIAMVLSKEELDALYDQAIRDRIFELPEPHPPGEGYLIQPSFGDSLELRAGGVIRRFAWESIRPIDSSKDQWSRLFSFVRALDSLATNQPAYRALPRPTGGYM